MPISNCENCHWEFEWRWEEAFDKFGFDDGACHIETPQVARVLVDAGYEAEYAYLGLHNQVILSIKRDGVELIGSINPGARIGYCNPRTYLPGEIVELLDSEFPETADEEVAP